MSDHLKTVSSDKILDAVVEELRGNDEVVFQHSFCQHIADDGTRMMNVDGVIYEWDEGMKHVMKCTDSLYEFMNPSKSAADTYKKVKVEESEEEEEEEDGICVYCEMCPCILDTEEGKDYLDTAQAMMEHNTPNKSTRYFLYRKFASLFHGPLGKGNRAKLPRCVVMEIRDSFPAKDDNYKGFDDGKCAV